MSKTEIKNSSLNRSGAVAVAYPFPMHLTQRYTYHLSILQFTCALSQFVPVYLLTLDEEKAIDRLFREEFGLEVPDTLHVVPIKNRRFGFKSNSIWFRQTTDKVLSRLSTQYSTLVVYSRNVKIFSYLVNTRAKRNSNIRYIFESHQLFSQNLGFMCEFDRAKREHKLEKALYPKADHIFANTQLLASQIKKIFSVPATVLPVAVREEDLAEFDSACAGDYQARYYDFVYVGSFDEWKGVETLVAALGKLSGQGWFGKAVLIGVREHELSKWRENVRSFGLEQQVDVVKRIPRKEVSVYLDRSKIGVVPNSLMDDSIFNTSPLKLFEYAARGLPVVASRVPAIDSRVRPPTMFWCLPDDAVSLSEALTDSLRISEKLSTENWKWASGYTWKSRSVNALSAIHIPINYQEVS